MTDKIHISITEVVTLTGKKKQFRLYIDDSVVNIPVDEALFAHYMNQFYREKPTPDQKKRLTTLLNLMRAAYTKGVADGKRKK